MIIIDTSSKALWQGSKKSLVVMIKVISCFTPYLLNLISILVEEENGIMFTKEKDADMAFSG